MKTNVEIFALANLLKFNRISVREVQIFSEKSRISLVDSFLNGFDDLGQKFSEKNLREIVREKKT